MNFKICPYCDIEAELIDSVEVYKKSYGFIYLCRNCGAYVGVHKSTLEPLGRLANAELRELRKEGHDLFDKLWRGENRIMKRKDAYSWLAEEMKIERDDCHFSQFSNEQIKQAILILKNK